MVADSELEARVREFQVTGIAIAMHHHVAER
jgi:hypothetical protein